jgi:non-ribosomal peptide synthetase component E (peptide arylation enzyme)
VVELLEAAAAETSDAVALTCGGRPLTYRELQAQSIGWHGLRLSASAPAAL